MIKGFVKIIILCLMHSPLLASAKNVEMEISISKDAELSNWLINYEFSEAIEAVSFDKTPYGFIQNDWRIQTAGATLDLSSLKVKLDIPGNHLLITLKSENDQFARGFYTPFLHFSDGSSAIFIGHYVPSQLKINNNWKSTQDIGITLTISPSESEKVLFDVKSDVNKLSVSKPDAMQYAYVGHLPAIEYEKFTALLDPELPNWIQAAILKAIPEFYNYFEAKTHAKLSFIPLFIINYKSGPDQPRLDGGAINRQVAINFVGDGWNQSQEDNVVNVLSLLAHEMAHLWNAQHWRHEDANPVWMHEGSANYFARKALLNFDYISTDEDAIHYRTQSEKCVTALKNGSINGLQNRSDKYICGEVIYKLSALMTNQTMHLDVWNNLVTNNDSLTYSEQQFIRALHKQSEYKNEASTIENALQKSSGDKFEALIRKYIGQHNYKDSIRPGTNVTTD